MREKFADYDNGQLLVVKEHFTEFLKWAASHRIERAIDVYSLLTDYIALIDIELDHRRVAEGE